MKAKTKLIVGIVAAVMVLVIGITTTLVLTGVFEGRQHNVVRSAEDLTAAIGQDSGDKNIVLANDVTVEGDISMTYLNNIDLNGYTLTVNGDLSITSDQEKTLEIFSSAEQNGLIVANTVTISAPKAHVEWSANVLAKENTFSVNVSPTTFVFKGTFLAEGGAAQTAPALQVQGGTVQIESPAEKITYNITVPATAAAAVKLVSSVPTESESEVKVVTAKSIAVAGTMAIESATGTTDVEITADANSNLSVSGTLKSVDAASSTVAVAASSTVTEVKAATVTNAGTIATIEATAAVTNTGTVTGEVKATTATVENSGTITGAVSAASVDNRGTSATITGSITATSSVTNSGTVTGTVTAQTVENQASATIVGDIKATGDVTNAGSVDGNIDTEAKVTVAAGAEVSGDVRGNEIDKATDADIKGDQLLTTKSEQVITVTMGNYTYGAVMPDYDITNTSNLGTAVTAAYKKVGEAESKYTTFTLGAKPTLDAGTYNLSVRVAGNETYNAFRAVLVFTVAKATDTGSVTLAGWTYGTTPNTPAVTGQNGTGDITYEYKVSGAADSTYTAVVPTNAGEYTVRATIAESANYLQYICTADFTIARANITPTVALAGWTYGEDAKTPVVTGNLGGGTVEYKYYTDATGGTALTAVPENAGTYYVEAIVAQTQNYNTATTVRAQFVIAQATLELGVTVANWTEGTTPTTPVITGYDDSLTTNYSFAYYEGEEATGTPVTMSTETTYGKYTVKLTVTDSNYTEASSTATYTFTVLVDATNIDTAEKFIFAITQGSTELKITHGTESTDVLYVNASYFNDALTAIADTTVGSTLTIDLNAKKLGFSLAMPGSVQIVVPEKMNLTFIDKATNFASDTIVDTGDAASMMDFANMTEANTAAIIASDGATITFEKICVLSQSVVAKGLGTGATKTINVIQSYISTSGNKVLATNALNDKNVNINVINSTITATSQYGIGVEYNTTGLLTITNSSITGTLQAVLVRAGTANITGSTLTATYTDGRSESWLNPETWGNGNIVATAALVVGGSKAQVASYPLSAIVTVENCTITGAEEDFAFAIYLSHNATLGNAAVIASLTLNGTNTITGNYVVYENEMLTTSVATDTDLKAALANSGIDKIIIADDITSGDLMVADGRRALTIDLNGKTINATSFANEEKLTILDETNTGGTIGVSIRSQSNSTLVINGGTYSGFSLAGNSTVTVKYAKIVAINDFTLISTFGSSSFTMESGEITLATSVTTAKLHADSGKITIGADVKLLMDAAGYSTIVGHNSGGDGIIVHVNEANKQNISLLFAKIILDENVSYDVDYLNYILTNSLDTSSPAVNIDLNGHDLTVTHDDVNESLKEGIINYGKTLQVDTRMTLNITDSKAAISSGTRATAETLTAGTLKLYNTTYTLGALTAKGGTVNLTNIKIDTWGAAIVPRDAGKVNIDKCYLRTDSPYGISTNARYGVNVEVTITNSTIVATSTVDSTALMLNMTKSLDITNSSIIGGIQAVFVRAGSATITDSELSASYAYNTAYLNPENWSSGNEAAAAALVVGSNGNGVSGYLYNAEVTLNGVTITGAGLENTFAIYLSRNAGLGNSELTATLTVTGDGVTIARGTWYETIVTPEQLEAASSGDSRITYKLTGGTYTEDVSALVADGYAATKVGETWTVYQLDTDGNARVFNNAEFLAATTNADTKHITILADISVDIIAFRNVFATFTDGTDSNGNAIRVVDTISDVTNLTIDLKGKNLTLTHSDVTDGVKNDFKNHGAALFVNEGQSLTFTDSTAKLASGATRATATNLTAGTLKLYNSTFLQSALTADAGVITFNKIKVEAWGSVALPANKGKMIVESSYLNTIAPYLVATNATTGAEIEMEIKNSTLDASSATHAEGTPLMINMSKSMIVDNCNIIGGIHAIFVRAGSATITDSELSAKYSTGDRAITYLNPENWKDGNEVANAALVVGSGMNYVNSYLYPATVTVSDTTITGSGLANTFAIYVSHNAAIVNPNRAATLSTDNVTVSGGWYETVINAEQLEAARENSATYVVTGGTYDAAPNNIATGYQAYAINDKVTVYETAKTRVVNSSEELLSAVASTTVRNIIFANNITISERIVISSEAAAVSKVFDLGGHTLESNETKGFVFLVLGCPTATDATDKYQTAWKNINLTIKNGTVKSDIPDAYIVDIRSAKNSSNVNVFIEDMTLDGALGMYTNGQGGGATIVATNTIFEGGVYLPAQNTYTFTNCTFSGDDGAYLKSGTYTFDNCKFNGTGEYAEPEYWGNGANHVGAGLVIDSCEGYQKPLNITIKDCTFTSVNGYGIMEFATSKNAEHEPYATIVLQGTQTFTGCPKGDVYTQNGLVPGYDQAE